MFQYKNKLSYHQARTRYCLIEQNLLKVNDSIQQDNNLSDNNCNELINEISNLKNINSVKSRYVNIEQTLKTISEKIKLNEKYDAILTELKQLNLNSKSVQS